MEAACVAASRRCARSSSTAWTFGTFCSTSLGGQGEGNLTTTDEAAAAETGVVLFRVQKEDVRGMDVSRATLSLHIRRYDLELDRVDFYFLDQA